MTRREVRLCGFKWWASPVGRIRPESMKGLPVAPDEPGIWHECGQPFGHDGKHVCVSVEICGQAMEVSE